MKHPFFTFQIPCSFRVDCGVTKAREMAGGRSVAWIVDDEVPFEERRDDVDVEDEVESLV